ncbi:dihydrolipoyl dehydrogenase [Methanothrix sp.]|uniref:dihydrolipoyl dehydrogenase n=1 Tax=Methanothrix sp. TaxID=90426 RepID=UPI00329748A4
MEKYDVIVIGSGSGMGIVSRAVGEGLRVALVDRGPLGGTCLNNGCIPSKMLIYPADVIRTLQDAKKVDIEGIITKINFQSLMSRMRSVVEMSIKEMEESIKSADNLTLYRQAGEFLGDNTLKVGDQILTAPKIAIASGSREVVPPIPGLKEAGYIDNTTLLNLDKLPESMIIIGAGYIGCEYGHFFSSMGTKVTILGRSPTVLANEDPEIRKIVNDVLSRDLSLLTNHEVVEVEVEGGKKVVSARNRLDNNVYRFEAEEVMIASGRRSNSDLLKPEKTGVETDQRGWIKVNKYLETTKPGIWALGDATGKHMFRHTANYEADIVSNNMFEDEKKENDEHAFPHAVFTHPQVAGVGLKEEEALAGGHKILVGRARYTEAAKGVAMAEDDGFVKVVVDDDTGKILGCSVVGSEAAELVQQVVYLMNTDTQDLIPLIRSQVIHPTISEVIAKAFANLEHPHDSEERKNVHI